MARLSYTRKILVVVLVLVLPLGYTMTMYLQAQGGQVGFAAQEHLGVEYLTRVSGLEEQVVAARHAVAAGSAVADAPLQTALDGVAAVEDRLGPALSTARSWETARTAIAAARSAGTGPLRQATQAWTGASHAVVALAAAAADGSNLTLDPDLDSYYVMDAVAFRFPQLVEDLNELPDGLSMAAAGGVGTAAGIDAARLQAAASLGSIASTLGAVTTGMAKSFAATADTALLTEKAAVHETAGAVTAVAATVQQAVAAGRLAAVGAAEVAPASAAVLSLWAALLPDLDALLTARMDRLTGSERLAIGVAAACALLAAYLVAGFYLSAVPPLRRMRDALAAIREGDLRVRVVVETRDEIGQMGAALNDTAGALGAAVERIGASARDVEEASAETSQLAGDIAAGAGAVHTQVATSVRGVAGVTEHAAAVAAAGEQMSAAIREISTGAAEAAGTASRAVTVTQGTGELVGRLRESCAAVRQVVGLISDVSDQTHLLALNASIEAARAGSAGDGFGVVAQEVRDLARESAAAAEDIARRVDAIEADSSAAVSALTDIGEVIGRVNDIQSSIAAAVDQQDAALAVLGRDVASVASAAADINDGMGQVETAADDSEQRAQEVHRVAGRLESSAAALREAVRRFAV
jgi:methyl-accepting chemotaxis protein